MTLKFRFEKDDYISICFYIYKKSKSYLKDKITSFFYKSIIISFMTFCFFKFAINATNLNSFINTIIIIIIVAIIFFINSDGIFEHNIKKKLGKNYDELFNLKKDIEREIELKDDKIVLKKTNEITEINIQKIIEIQEINNVFYIQLDDKTYITINTKKIIEGDVYQFINKLKDVSIPNKNGA
jgi:hypothetical protein